LQRCYDPELLSDSDIEALDHGFNEYAGKSFDSVKLQNHNEQAWLKAVERNPGAEASDIFFEDMIEEEWLAEELKETARFMAIAFPVQNRVPQPRMLVMPHSRF